MKKAALLAAALALVSIGAGAQAPVAFPERPIRLIVPSAAGGPADLMARVIAQKLADRLRQPVIVDNKPGGNSVIAATEVANARPDGHTILLADMGAAVLNPLLYTTLPYVARDLEPITKVATVPNIVVTNAAGPKSFKALLEMARANPGKLSYGYGATSTRLGGLLLKDTFNLDVIEVPYKGGALVAQGLLANDVTFTVDGPIANLEQIKAGRLFALVNLGAADVPGLPNLPRVADVAGGAGMESSGWNVLMAPKATPAAIVRQLNGEVVRILALPDVKDRLAAAGIVADPSSPAELRAFLAAESRKWQRVIDRSGIPKIQ